MGLREDVIESIDTLNIQAASLLLYQSIFGEEEGRLFLEVLGCIRAVIERAGDRFNDDRSSGFKCLQSYSAWFYALAARDRSWQDFLIGHILENENPFTQQVQQTELAALPPALVMAAKHDLRILQQLCTCDMAQISHWIQIGIQLAEPPLVWQPSVSQSHPLESFADWGEGLDALASYYQQRGTGLFARYRGFRWQSGQFVSISSPDPIALDELVGYEHQRQTLMDNTEALLAGYPAQHVLLYGSRGSGKSSLVKSLLNAYGDRGLRLIEIAKANLTDLPEIVERLRTLPQKFVLFVDDLSFEEDDDTFKALKVVLEGTLTARPQNVAVYATSNRRHLVREFFGDRPRPSDEVHTWDSMQEKLSFSDRFGITLTFLPADQDKYLEIVRHLAGRAEIPLNQEDLEYRALRWATENNGRSGRSARQFVDFLCASLSTEKR